jgi:hypothetical protein
MGNLINAIQELRAERSRAQSQLEKLDQAISVIESLNGTGSSLHNQNLSSHIPEARFLLADKGLVFDGSNRVANHRFGG